jgi:TolA-binding protein
VEQALEVFKTMLAKFPSSPFKPAIEFKIGDCYELLGLLKEALAQYKEVRPRYGNQSAVDIRIRGVEARLKDIEGPAKISRTRPAKKTRK